MPPEIISIDKNILPLAKRRRSQVIKFSDKNKDDESKSLKEKDNMT